MKAPTFAEAETDWSCATCGAAIGADDDAVVLFVDRPRGCVMLRWPIRYHEACAPKARKDTPR